jgi:hypothetical protein
VEYQLQSGFHSNFDKTRLRFRIQHAAGLQAAFREVRRRYLIEASDDNLSSRLSEDFWSAQNMPLKFPQDKPGLKVTIDSYPLKATMRRGNGLKIHLAGNKNIRTRDRCKTQTFLVHSPFDVPAGFEIEEMVHFLYGYDLEVLITPEITQTDEDLRSFTPEERGCYFEGERKLKYFKVYTRRNCELETLSEFLEVDNEYNCTPFFLLRNDSREVCDHRYEEEIKREIGNALKARDQILKNSDCLDECNMIKYRTEIIAHNVQLDKNAFNKSYWIEFDFETEIEFKFKDVDIVPLRRYRQMTFSDFLAQSGGMMGLFAGVSALSVIELFYFMTLRWMVNLWRWISDRYFDSA